MTLYSIYLERNSYDFWVGTKCKISFDMGIGSKSFFFFFGKGLSFNFKFYGIWVIKVLSGNFKFLVTWVSHIRLKSEKNLSMRLFLGQGKPQLISKVKYTQGSLDDLSKSGRLYNRLS